MPGRPGDPANSRYFAISSVDKSGEGYEATYNDLVAALTANGTDLTLADESHVYEGFADFGPTGLQTPELDIGDHYSNIDMVSHRLILRAAAGEEPWSSKANLNDKSTFFILTSTSSGIAIRSNNLPFTFERMGLENTSGTMGLYFDAGGSWDSIVRNCFLRAQRHVLRTRIRRTYVYNNVIWGLESGQYVCTFSSADVYAANNLFIGEFARSEGFFNYDSSANCVFRNNIYIHQGGGRTFQPPSGTSGVYENNSHSDNEPSAQYVSPQFNVDKSVEFVNFAGRDFHVVPGSQFIDTGVDDSPLFDYDFEDDPRAGPNWTRGPDEFIDPGVVRQYNALLFGGAP